MMRTATTGPVWKRLLSISSQVQYSVQVYLNLLDMSLLTSEGTLKLVNYSTQLAMARRSVEKVLFYEDKVNGEKQPEIDLCHPLCDK